MTLGVDDVFRYIFLFGGILLTLLWVIAIWSSKWKKYPCDVIYYNIYQWNYQNRVNFFPEVVYEYTIDESVFRGTKVDLFGDRAFKNEDELRSILENICSARVCPVNKSVSYLILPNKNTMYGLFFSAIISFVAAIFMSMFVIH